MSSAESKKSTYNKSTIYIIGSPVLRNFIQRINSIGRYFTRSYWSRVYFGAWK